MTKRTLFFVLCCLVRTFSTMGLTGQHVRIYRNLQRTQLHSSNELFVVNWEGCIADTVDWRIQDALNVAAATWPEADDCLDRDDVAWLENKLAALAHVFDSLNHSVVCEYALAVRLLLEEQELDGGRSNGKTGKYASKYHPQQKIETSRGRGSRPLTVGEVLANWRQGGMLRDALQVRYHCDGKDPMPILQTNVERIRAKPNSCIPCLTDESISDVLHACPHKVILTVDHERDLKVAESTLETTNLAYRVVNSVAEALEVPFETVLLVRRSDTLAQIIQQAPERSTVFVIDSSWSRLEQSIILFGDNIPRLGSVGKSFLPDKNLSLQLARWARNTHPSQHAAAIMNAWTGVVGYSEFTEMLSARVIRN